MIIIIRDSALGIHARAAQPGYESDIVYLNDLGSDGTVRKPAFHDLAVHHVQTTVMGLVIEDASVCPYARYGPSMAVLIPAEVRKAFDFCKGFSPEKPLGDFLPAGGQSIEKLDPARTEIGEDMRRIFCRQRIACMQERLRVPALGKLRGKLLFERVVRAAQHGADRVALGRPLPQLLGKRLRIQQLQALFTVAPQAVPRLVRQERGGCRAFLFDLAQHVRGCCLRKIEAAALS